jgi:hypothetical protein
MVPLSRLAVQRQGQTQYSGKRVSILSTSYPHTLDVALIGRPKRTARDGTRAEQIRCGTRRSPRDLPQLEAMAQDLAAIRQSVEQLAASREQLAHDMVKLQSAVQEIEQKTFTPAPKPNAASDRKPQATSPRPRQSIVQPTTQSGRRDHWHRCAESYGFSSSIMFRSGRMVIPIVGSRRS